LTKASEINKEFYAGKRVFITGHTGFKGAWLTQVLSVLGAKTRGYALAPEKDSLFDKINGYEIIDHVEGDVRDLDKLTDALLSFEPEIIFHLAAQVTVQDCFNDPHRAFSTNIMGNVNLFEAVRKCPSVKSVVTITTDKVYENKGDGAVYKVGDTLACDDPCGTSNICVEYIAEAYKKSYLQTENRTVGIATARPSNVIAGGDHVQTRLIPSILHGFASGKPAELRNPEQSRSWQAVIDALNGYMTIAGVLFKSPAEYSRPWNIGPSKDGIRSVGEIYEKIRFYFDSDKAFANAPKSDVKESETLGLDIEETVDLIKWSPELTLDKMLFDLTDFFKRQQNGEPERDICMRQIREYFEI